MEHFWDIKDLTVTYKTMEGTAVAVDHVSLYVDSGEVIGKLEDSDLFGTYYPWLASTCIDDEGNFVTVLTEDRDDESAKECIAFTMKGF